MIQVEEEEHFRDNKTKHSEAVREPVVDDIVIEPDIGIKSFGSLVHIGDCLKLRGTNTPKDIILTYIDSKGKEKDILNFEKLKLNVEKMAAYLINSKPRGTITALIFAKIECIDYIVAMLGCFLAGHIAVPIVSTSGYNRYKDMIEILSITKAKLVLTTDENIKLINKDVIKEGLEFPDKIEWIKINGKIVLIQAISSKRLNTHIQKSKSQKPIQLILNFLDHTGAN